MYGKYGMSGAGLNKMVVYLIGIGRITTRSGPKIPAAGYSEEERVFWIQGY